MNPLGYLLGQFYANLTIVSHGLFVCIFVSRLVDDATGRFQVKSEDLAGSVIPFVLCKNPEGKADRSVAGLLQDDWKLENCSDEWGKASGIRERVLRTARAMWCNLYVGVL